MVAAVKGYKLVLVMPESMSIERRRLMLAYGASFRSDAQGKGHEGRDLQRAQELLAETDGGWMPQQFENPANVAGACRAPPRRKFSQTLPIRRPP